MLIIALDLNKKALKHLGTLLKCAVPDADYRQFTSMEECLLFAEKHKIDLAYLEMDTGIPYMNGLILLKKLRKHNPLMNVVFLIHGEYNNRDAHTALQCFATDYVEKPMTYERLQHGLQHLWFPMKK